MSFSPSTATTQIREIFESEITQAGGSVTDVFHDDSRLFLRSTLPAETDIRPRDRLRPGVALRAIDDAVLISPYTFRVVCSNGAIMAHAFQTRRLNWVSDGAAPYELLEASDQLRHAIRNCARPEAFEAAADQMRTALDS